MRAARGLWRWRHNALRRRTDLVEAWVAFAALLLILLAAPVVGWLSGVYADDALERTVREQHEQRHAVSAAVVRRTEGAPVDPDPEASTDRDALNRVLASWKGPDGSRHTGTVKVGLQQSDPGERIRIWTDAQGRQVGRPMDSATATTHAVLAGFGAAVVTAGLVEGSRRLVVWRLIRRRYEDWDRAWAQAGPDWGRTGTGS